MAISLEQLAHYIIKKTPIVFNGSVSTPDSLTSERVALFKDHRIAWYDLNDVLENACNYIKKDTLVEVWDDTTTKRKRYATGLFNSSGDIEVFMYGATSDTIDGDHDVACYKHYSIIEK